MSIADQIYAGPGIFIWGIGANGTPDVDSVRFDFTQGGIMFTTTSTYFEPTIDQTGTAPVKSVYTGSTGTIAFETPILDFEKVVSFNPNADKVVDGDVPSKVKYEVYGLAGKELPRKRSVIMPVGVTDPGQFIYIESVGVKFDMNAAYVLDNNRRFTISATAFPSLDSNPPGLLYTWGDISATA